MPQKASDGRYEPLIAEMRRRVLEASDSKKKIVWLDETVFTKTTQQKQEWSKPHHNFTIPCEALGVKYVAVLTAISEGSGFEHTELYDKAVDHELFIEYLKVFRQKNKRRRLVLFMDNLQVHKKSEVIDCMKELKIEWIWNVPYSPDY